MSYFCTLPPGHGGEHRNEFCGDVVSWPNDPAPAPQPQERRVLARGWVVQAAAGERPIPDPPRATAAEAWGRLCHAMKLSPDQLRKHWPCLRAVYVEIVEADPPKESVMRFEVSMLEEMRAKMGEADPPDGTERLCRALYGRPARTRDYLGGSNARMLHDAADRLESEPAAERDACGYVLEDETECVSCERPVCRRDGCAVWSEVGQALCRDCADEVNYRGERLDATERARVAAHDARVDEFEATESGEP